MGYLAPATLSIDAIGCSELFKALTRSRERRPSRSMEGRARMTKGSLSLALSLDTNCIEHGNGKQPLSSPGTSATARALSPPRALTTRALAACLPAHTSGGHHLGRCRRRRSTLLDVAPQHRWRLPVAAQLKLLTWRATAARPLLLASRPAAVRAAARARRCFARGPALQGRFAPPRLRACAPFSAALLRDPFRRRRRRWHVVSTRTRGGDAALAARRAERLARLIEG